MLNNSFDIEKFILVTRQQELLQELKQINLLEEADAARENQPLLPKILGSMGWWMVRLGSHLVSKYELGDGFPIRHPDIKIA